MRSMYDRLKEEAYDRYIGDARDYLTLEEALPDNYERMEYEDALVKTVETIESFKRGLYVIFDLHEDMGTTIAMLEAYTRTRSIFETYKARDRYKTSSHEYNELMRQYSNIMRKHSKQATATHQDVHIKVETKQLQSLLEILDSCGITYEL